MEATSLTDEQKQFLEECENEFKDRYTEKDVEFMKIKNMKVKHPPIVDPWYARRGYHNGRGGRYRHNNDRYRRFEDRYQPTKAGYPDSSHRRYKPY